MKDAPSPPPAPDYTGAARAQGTANTETAVAQARLGNPNINNPYGSQQVSWSAPNDQGVPTPTINQTLNPQSQQIFDAQQQTRMGLANLGQQGIGTAQRTMGTPFQPSGPGVQTSLGYQGQPQGAPDLAGYGQAGANVPAGQRIAGAQNLSESAQRNIDVSRNPDMPVRPGMTGQQAIMSRLQPQIERERGQLETQLRNQGLVAGGEAYGNSMTLQNQRENDMLAQAALQGIGLDFTANQQGFGQAMAQGQFGNQGLGQNQQAALAQQAAQNAAQQQGFGQQFGVQGLQNQAIGQNQGAALQQQQAQNAAVGQGFNQQLQGGQFGNQAQQQALQQQLYQRNLPLNEITALMSGSQIQNPQFQQYQGANINPAPMFNAAQQQAQYNQGLYGLGVGQYNQGLSTLGQLGSAGMGLYGAMNSPWAGLSGLFSDRRLKSNIVRTGTHSLGIGIYEYDIFGRRERGVMAAEVLTVRPEAVMTHPSGYLMVDYGRL